MEGDTRHVLSFGGGVNTIALLLMLVEQGAPLDEVVFADTGVEVPETYEYLPRVRGFLQEKGIPFTILAKPKGRNLYETSWKRQVFPSALWRWSTRDFKVTPIQGHYRKLGTHIQQYVGIAYDEVHRMKDSLVPYVTNLYPLIDSKMTREDCIAVIAAAGWPIPVKSGCYFCPFNSIGRWTWLLNIHPELFDKAIALEENSKHFPAQRLTDQVFRKRDKVTLRELRLRIIAGQAVPLSEDGTSACGGECMT